MIDQSHSANPSARLHPMPPSTGEWVKFKIERGSLPKHAHVCPEGYYVGIYVRQSRDVFGKPVMEHVAPVDEFGENLFGLPRVITGSLDVIDPAVRNFYDLQPKADAADPNVHHLHPGLKHVRLDPADVVELHHAEDISHLPAHRIAKTLAVDPDHQLPAWHRRQQALAATKK